MRIISGKYKGKKIIAGSSLAIRPVTTKIKESIFNTLGEYVLNKEIADLFSGSGSFGLEALSRGAKKITFVEKATSSINILKKNLAALRIPHDRYSIIQTDVLKYCRQTEIAAELILMDPPFNFSHLQDLIEMIVRNRVLAAQGILVVHHEISNPIQSENSTYHLFKQRRFGRNLVSIILGKEDHV